MLPLALVLLVFAIAAGVVVVVVCVVVVAVVIVEMLRYHYDVSSDDSRHVPDALGIDHCLPGTLPLLVVSISLSIDAELWVD